MSFLFSDDRRHRITDNAAHRRRRERLRRAALACCCGLTVWAALQCMLSLTDRQTLVVARTDLMPGHVLTDADLQLAHAPTTHVLDDTYTEIQNVRGKVTRIPIAAGSPLLPGMMSTVPAPSADHTSLAIPLASLPDTLIPGDEVRLVSTTRVLAERATVLDIPDPPDDDGLLSSSDDGWDGSTVTFSVTPDEAIAILSARDTSPILAVTR